MEKDMEIEMEIEVYGISGLEFRSPQLHPKGELFGTFTGCSSWRG